MPTFELTPAFSRLVAKLGGHNRWSLSFGDGMRAVFQIGDEVRSGEVHIIWEFVGDHDAYDRAYY